VSRTEPKAFVQEVDLEDLGRGWDMFRSLLRYWQAANSYWPGEKA
jgi:hypothetical protein